MGQAVVLPLEGGASGLKDLAVVLAAVVGRPLRREQLLAVHQELRDRVTGPAEALRGCAAVGKFHVSVHKSVGDVSSTLVQHDSSSMIVLLSERALLAVPKGFAFFATSSS